MENTNYHPNAHFILQMDNLSMKSDNSYSGNFFYNSNEKSNGANKIENEFQMQTPSQIQKNSDIKNKIFAESTNIQRSPVDVFYCAIQKAKDSNQLPFSPNSSHKGNSNFKSKKSRHDENYSDFFTSHKKGPIIVLKNPITDFENLELSVPIFSNDSHPIGIFSSTFSGIDKVEFFQNFSYQNQKNELSKLNSNKQMEKKDQIQGCNCRKSKCLKFYCECFQKGTPCVGCNCCDCKNTSDDVDRKTKYNLLKQKNESVFMQKIMVLEGNNEKVHKKGCNCKKNSCLKNYCECHQLSVNCSNLCNCSGCKNCDQDTNETKKLEKKETTGKIKKKTIKIKLN